MRELLSYVVMSFSLLATAANSVIVTAIAIHSGDVPGATSRPSGDAADDDGAGDGEWAEAAAG
jgi:hypothetical protein